MDKFVIRGGEPLLGTIRVSGAKNAALPCMAAALLTDQPVILENIPQVRDIQTTRNLIAAMGAEVELGFGRAQHRTTIHCENLATPDAERNMVDRDGLAVVFGEVSGLDDAILAHRRPNLATAPTMTSNAMPMMPTPAMPHIVEVVTVTRKVVEADSPRAEARTVVT